MNVLKTLMRRLMNFVFCSFIKRINTCKTIFHTIQLKITMSFPEDYYTYNKIYNVTVFNLKAKNADEYVYKRTKLFI